MIVIQSINSSRKIKYLVENFRVVWLVQGRNTQREKGKWKLGGKSGSSFFFWMTGCTFAFPFFLIFLAVSKLPNTCDDERWYNRGSVSSIYTPRRQTRTRLWSVSVWNVLEVHFWKVNHFGMWLSFIFSIDFIGCWLQSHVIRYQ
jgi:hypothetical protein